MKVKVTLKFRGREMAHTEFGFQVVQKFLADIAPYGHPDFEPKLIGRGINVMISPLPRNKRAKNPRQTEKLTEADQEDESEPVQEERNRPATVQVDRGETEQVEEKSFSNNPFEQLEVK